MTIVGAWVPRNTIDPDSITMKIHYDDLGGSTFEIVSAPTSILVTAEFIESAITRDVDHVHLVGYPAPGVVVTFTDDYDHRFVYRIVEFDLTLNAWRLEWPD